MSITEKTLKKWRRESLQGKDKLVTYQSSDIPDITLRTSLLDREEKILRLTQELMDQKLKEGR